MAADPSPPNGSTPPPDSRSRRWFVLAAVAAGIVTIVFAVVGDGSGDPSGGGLLLEYGHVGVWGLLTAALATAAATGRWQRLATVLAMAALILYAAFLGTLLTR